MPLKKRQIIFDKPILGGPIPALELLRSAGCFAEFALLAGTWSTTGIENALDNRGPANRNEIEVRPPGSNVYRRYLDGRVPSHRKIKAIVEKYPRTSLVAWSQHVLGLLICDQHRRMSELFYLAREPDFAEWEIFLYDSNLGNHPSLKQSEDTSRYQYGTEITDLISLVARIRFGDKNNEYKFFLMPQLFDVFPRVIARSPHLYLARDVLLSCLREFMRWPIHYESSDPYSYSLRTREFSFNERFLEPHWAKLMQEILHEQNISRSHGINLPTEEHVQKYTRNLAKITRPILR